VSDKDTDADDYQDCCNGLEHGAILLDDRVSNLADCTVKMIR